MIHIPVHFTLSGHYEADLQRIKLTLAQLQEGLMTEIKTDLLDAAHFMVTMAKAYCPVDTGTLQKTIRKERGGSGLHWRVMRVRAGGYFVNPKTGRICDYATYVEARTPFMAPAYQSVETFLADQIRLKVLEHVP